MLIRAVMYAFQFCTSRERINTATRSPRNAGSPSTQWRPL
uniref:Uncharacterized protein n=1 Tax=Anguilla anguilla TaxID=7936 RepID=A0A0E9WGF9_ANGAN